MKKRTTFYLDSELCKEFKEVCDREGPNVTMSGKVEGFIARHVAVHGQGNPQLRLETFFGDVKKKCWRCEGIFPNLVKVQYISGLVAQSCPTCLKRDQDTRTVKKVYGVI